MVTSEQTESGMRNVFKNRAPNTGVIRLYYKAASSLTLLSTASEWNRIGNPSCATTVKNTNLFIGLED